MLDANNIVHIVIFDFVFQIARLIYIPMFVVLSNSTDRKNRVHPQRHEYTIALPAENPTKLSTQIFYFLNFVTEIFRRKVHLYFSQK